MDGIKRTQQKGNANVTMADLKKKLDKGIAYLKRNGMRNTLYRSGRKVMLVRPVRYERWLKHHTADKKDQRRQREEQVWKQTKVYAVLFPGDEERKGETWKSLQNQTYGNIAAYDQKGWTQRKQESADYILLIQNGTVLRPEAVYELVKEAKKQENLLLYTDHDIRDSKGHLKEPFCKPEYDPVWQSQMNYMGTMMFASASYAQKIKDLMPEQVWKELPKLADQVVHLPKILYHITETLQKDTECTKGWYHKKELKSFPLLSVIIPNKDHIEELQQCIESIQEKGGYENLEILIAENNSTEKETFQFYDELQKKDSRIRVVTWDGKFNYSAINNAAVRQAKGEYLLFLNNDTKIKKQGSIEELMRCVVSEKAGAAGCLLLYGDHTIQHAGVVLGYGGVAGHAFEGMSQEVYKKQKYSRCIRQMSAVTAACMLAERRAFEEVGGFTEELGVAYNDIDFCMKLRKAGRMVLYDPFAELYHYESLTRGFEMTAEKAARVKREAEYFCQIWKEEISRGDRFYNPNLTLEKADFSLIR